MLTTLRAKTAEGQRPPEGNDPNHDGRKNGFHEEANKTFEAMKWAMMTFNMRLSARVNSKMIITPVKGICNMEANIGPISMTAHAEHAAWLAPISQKRQLLH